jgi:hypothetical protein
MTLSNHITGLSRRIFNKLIYLPKQANRGLRAFVFFSKRTPGGWYIEDLKSSTSLVKEIPGDFIEIGAFLGTATRKLVLLAAEQGKRVHAVDSFEGMAPPTRFDFRPAGNLSIGGVGRFYATMDAAGISRDAYDVHIGWIPDVLGTITERNYSFAIIDVDNYQPTADALLWLWPRMAIGGIIAFDDFYPNNQMECARAIKEFLARENDYCIVGFQNYQLYVLKTAGGPLPTGHGIPNYHLVT